MSPLVFRRALITATVGSAIVAAACSGSSTPSGNPTTVAHNAAQATLNANSWRVTGTIEQRTSTASAVSQRVDIVFNGGGTEQAIQNLLPTPGQVFYQFDVGTNEYKGGGSLGAFKCGVLHLAARPVVPIQVVKAISTTPSITVKGGQFNFSVDSAALNSAVGKATAVPEAITGFLTVHGGFVQRLQFQFARTGATLRGDVTFSQINHAPAVTPPGVQCTPGGLLPPSALSGTPTTIGGSSPTSHP